MDGRHANHDGGPTLDGTTVLLGYMPPNGGIGADVDAGGGAGETAGCSSRRGGSLAVASALIHVTMS